MKTRVKYAILKYVPSIERNEKINVAVVLHCPEKKQLEMTIINNWKRVKNFDDEADTQFLKRYVEDMKEQFTVDLVNDFDGIKLDNPFFLDESTRYFVNKFVFEIHEIDTDENFNNLLNNLKAIYLYYENEKGKRKSEAESKAYIERHFLENNISYERHGSRNAIQEQYGNNINFDYKIDGNYYKLIFLTEDNYAGYVGAIKMWITNAAILKNESKQLIFVIDDLLKNERTESYKKMISDFAKIITVQEFISIKSKK